MAKVKHQLANIIIKDHFGELVSQVASYLIKFGRRGIGNIFQNILPSMAKKEVKQALKILIHHHIVVPVKNTKEHLEYQILLDHVVDRRRFPRYVYCAKAKFGDIAELIIETLLLNGSDFISRSAKSVTERLEADDSEDGRTDEKLVVKKYSDLINAHYLKRVSIPLKNEEDQQPSLCDNESNNQHHNAFLIPEGIGQKRKETAHTEASFSKRSKFGLETSSQSQTEIEKYMDEDVLWHVNFEKFDTVLVDQLIIDAVAQQFDQSASRVVAVILKLAESERRLDTSITASFSFYEIMKKLPNIPIMNDEEAKQYLTLLCDEKTAGFLSKTDENAGGMYCANIEKSMEMLCSNACSQIIQERFGSKACRVFRLLYMKKHLEQKQISELAMIPFKEVKELLYKLFEERFIKMQEISKAGDYAPSRTFYLFSIDLTQLSRLLLGRCYQTLGNLMKRRESQMVENKRLLEKNEKLEGILTALAATNEDSLQVVEELEELITPTEKSQLEKLKLDLARLEQGEIQVESTVLIIQSYLRFNS